MSPLPNWVQYVQALGLPIFSAVLALVGGWIGWQQMQVASVRLHLDLYERRYRVFEALRELIRHAAYQTDLDVEAVRAHAFTAGQAGSCSTTATGPPSTCSRRSCWGHS
jgi:hypothetical protein